MKRRIYYTLMTAWLSLSAILFSAESLLARNSRDDRDGNSGKTSVTEILDSLVYTTYFKDEHFSPSKKEPYRPGLPSHFVPQFSDSVYAARISALDRKTAFNLVYNEHVRGFIRIYAVDKRNMTAKILGLSKIYFPLFEENLERYNVPLEMKYLAIVESALNPTAVSSAGARGLWQFMYGTGKMYGLETSSFIEDRYDPYKATAAASKHLRDLYNIYGDWFLALAAYNSGPGNVNKAIRRAGGIKNYWAIWNYLPAETRGYVPAFIAVNYIMNYYKEHNIQPIEPGFLYNEIDALKITRLVSFEQINETIGVPMKDLQFLNPQYKLGLIPGTSYSGNMLRLPRKYVGQFQRREEEIYAYKSEQVIERAQLLARVQSMDGGGSVSSAQSAGGTMRMKMHEVRQGETLGSIARVYRCDVSQLIRWNDLKVSEVSPGQRLIVFAVPESSTAQGVSVQQTASARGLSAPLLPAPIFPPEQVQRQAPIVMKPRAQEPKAQEQKVALRKEKIQNHKVKKGETVASISRQYGVSSESIAELNNLSGRKQIRPGQVLKITGKASSAKSEARISSAKKESGSSRSHKYHKVKKGETLSSIADKYALSVSELSKKNNLGKKKLIRPGQKLNVTRE
ncbi:LysM peptidoglycan-binding domain-containing protein [Chlorobium phaeobacteroides]|uniref:LysM peptidoglycan-binding domain-containing protein n=1 Tax=Chlorobium phaeobacteroides TaxID=1096 RepID=UPI00295260E6|nr:LysM peptidoglycan-binding domain-containing protein [Chlorobium phaeobacteroides]